MEYSKILEIPPYSLNKDQKNDLLTRELKELSLLHYEKCEEYRRLVDVLGIELKEIESYTDLPFVPVQLFKYMNLKSVEEDEVFKVMTSSGTSGQAVSKIYLDRSTATNQQKTLVKIVSDFAGKGRLPMIILDSSSVLKNRTMFSARGAGILGFSIFAKDRIFAFDEEMNLDLEGLHAFIEKHRGKRILLFGFTFMIWQYFYAKLKELNSPLMFEDAILIHGGGWKKLENEAVDSKTFKDELNKVCGIKEVHDYYGMVEQTGCIYMECEHGHLHASVFSDVIARRSSDYSVCDDGEEGILQVVSMLPESYPGHSILTEDRGVVLGVDDCPCGRKGKYFKVLGRIKNAEVRGCSDTFEK
jgi:phenylacetate-coenzyme A ligase PaaK-like adenylate-forming protein